MSRFCTRFGPLKLDRFHERHMRIEDANGRLLRHR